MNPYHSKQNTSKEIYTSERCYILERLHNHDSNQPFSIAEARVEIGVTTAWHKLKDTTEYYYILNGKGKMYIGDEEPFIATKNDIITIPSNMKQRIENIGDEELIFLAICTPPFQTDSYIELE